MVFDKTAYDSHAIKVPNCANVRKMWKSIVNKGENRNSLQPKLNGELRQKRRIGTVNKRKWRTSAKKRST
jgi:hypothetical protein